jgi:hypothetical protein
LFPGSGFTVVGKEFTSNIGENYAVSKFVVRDSQIDFLPLVFFSRQKSAWAPVSYLTFSHMTSEFSEIIEFEFALELSMTLMGTVHNTLDVD